MSVNSDSNSFCPRIILSNVVQNAFCAGPSQAMSCSNVRTNCWLKSVSNVFLKSANAAGQSYAGGQVGWDTRPNIMNVLLLSWMISLLCGSRRCVEQCMKSCTRSCTS